MDDAMFGCPFVGMFYFCNVENDPISKSAYWLPKEYFVYYGKPIQYRPFGHHALKLLPDGRDNEIMSDWLTEASVIERLSSLVSAFYMLVGMLAGISRAIIPYMEDNSLNSLEE